ncbi:lipase family protein [Marinibactrum halimedae]|uniref:Lipase n=1 Tax=Marinibactrum halimedae TaxID=1444977 RepID=A0AA37WPQ5_9GAMM|nr:lipase family protein [Marinibactrum halimedae]MCD9459175.1 lipase family protein [Marinibactrum halimedae]GLS27246.1 lipase [Marinibactrum halimedae]
MPSSPMYFPPAPFDITMATLAVTMVDDAYDQYRQWKVADEPKAKHFQWSTPSASNSSNDIHTSLSYSPTLWGTSGSFLWTSTEPFGYVAHDKERVYLVIRGTQSGTDWLSNLDSDLTEFKINTVPQKQNTGKVHEGFFEIYETLRDQIFTQIKNAIDKIDSPEPTLYVFGHSLGSALATMAAGDIAVNLGINAAQQLHLYTLASPRVGDNTFADFFLATQTHCYRIANSSDMVTNVPFAVMGKKCFQHVGITVPFTANYDSAAKNHSTTHSYEYALFHPDAPMK